MYYTPPINPFSSVAILQRKALLSQKEILLADTYFRSYQFLVYDKGNKKIKALSIHK